MKNYQQNLPWTQNVLLTLEMHTDNAQMNFVTIALCRPIGAAIVFSENWNFLLKWGHFEKAKPTLKNPTSLFECMC